MLAFAVKLHTPRVLDRDADSRVRTSKRNLLKHESDRVHPYHNLPQVNLLLKGI